MNPAAGKGWTIRGRHVAIGLAVFFGLIFAVNGVFLYVSLSSHPGVTSDDAYREGLRYNREIEAADRQRALGWKTEVAVEGGRISLTLADRSGAPLHGLDVRLALRRPAHDGADRSYPLEETGPGRYALTAETPADGRWLLRFDITDRRDRYLRIEEEIFLRRSDAK